MPLTVDLAALGPFTRRFRRPLAAASAGLAVLIIATLRGPAAPSADASHPPPLGAAEVAVPITLAIGSDLIAPGATIDVVAVPDLGASAQIVARDARVIRTANTAGFSTGTTSTIVVAVTEADALQLAEAGAAGTLTAVIHAGP